MSEALLRCRGLDVRAGSRSLVRALDLAVLPGQRWALVGPNGAGKTTLLNILAGARRADSGVVEIAGRPLGEWGAERLAGLRAMVTDRWVDPFAIPVIDTVLAARHRLRGALRIGGRRGAFRDLHAEAVARRCLAGMDCAGLADRDIRHLSRGERQRVALAAGLAQEAPLLLLDEPISHQDPRHQIHVMRELQSSTDLTVIGALHDINAAARFSTHALLLSGDGPWQAGESATVLTPANLSRLFATRIAELDAGTHRVFVSDTGESA